MGQRGQKRSESREGGVPWRVVHRMRLLCQLRREPLEGSEPRTRLKWMV